MQTVLFGHKSKSLCKSKIVTEREELSRIFVRSSVLLQQRIPATLMVLLNLVSPVLYEHVIYALKGLTNGLLLGCCKLFITIVLWQNPCHYGNGKAVHLCLRNKIRIFPQYYISLNLNRVPTINHITVLHVFQGLFFFLSLHFSQTLNRFHMFNRFWSVILE